MKDGPLDLGHSVQRERVIAVSTRRSDMEFNRVTCTLEQYSRPSYRYTALCVLCICLDNETSRPALSAQPLFIIHN